ncbi:hypothetical protein D3C83_87020 [compost metagenome]
MRLTTSNPGSSVRSSPTNTGRRPANGASPANSAMALPLSLPLGLISTTNLPVCSSNLSPSPAAMLRISRSARGLRVGARR